MTPRKVQKKVDDLLLRACRREQVERVPVWFMRQAGRCLPEYLEIRERYGLLEICRTPELATEATLQPVRRFGVDAAILFSDIVIPLQAVDVDVEIAEGIGPVLEKPLREAADVAALRALDPKTDVSFVLDTIALLKDELAVPLIGFSGAPFTLACYLIEGGPSKDHALTRAFMIGQPDLWKDLMQRLSAIVLTYARAQVEAGAAAVQLFDSWVGALSLDAYERFVRPYSQEILDGLADLGAPRIHFGIGTSELLPAMSAGAEVVGVDWRLPLDEARRRIGPDVALQGNLDPAVCLAPWDVVEEAAQDVLRRGGGRGHIFNLGHGVHPDTDPDTLTRLVELVHEWSIPSGGEGSS